MTVLHREMDIDLTPEVVFEQLLDLSGWPRWMASVSDAGWEGPPAEGARLWFRAQHNGREPRVEAEVTDLRPGKAFAYRHVGGDAPFTEGMTDIEWTWRLFRRPGGGTRLRFALSYEAEAGLPFVQELIGTRMQVLNTADTWLQALRSLGAASAVAEVAEA